MDCSSFVRTITSSDYNGSLGRLRALGLLCWSRKRDWNTRFHQPIGFPKWQGWTAGRGNPKLLKKLRGCVSFYFFFFRIYLKQGESVEPGLRSGSNQNRDWSNQNRDWSNQNRYWSNQNRDWIWLNKTEYDDDWILMNMTEYDWIWQNMTAYDPNMTKYDWI